MFKIVKKETLTEGTTLFEVEAPEIAKRAQAGQFIILRLHEYGERIPLSLADFDPEKGTLTLVVMALGKTTHEFSAYETGDTILDVVGPLGHATPIEKVGHVIVVGGGFGAAPLFPVAKAYKKAGNKITAILGARNKDLLIFEDRLASVCDEVLVSTDDGSKGHKGLVTEVLQKEIERNRVDLVMAVGPAIMMKFVSLTTKPFGIKTLVSLNPIIIDGTGMCGGCRVTVGGETKFACVEGPDFDGHQVDWDLLMGRQGLYQAEEKHAFERYQCRLVEQGEKLRETVGRSQGGGKNQD